MRRMREGEDNFLFSEPRNPFNEKGKEDFYHYINKLCSEYDKLNNIIKQLNDGIVITDPYQPDNPIIFVNDGFRRLTQYDENEVIGKNCRFLQGKDTAVHTIDRIKSAIANKNQLTTEILNYKKDGTPFWNELKINPIFDSDGKLLYFVGIQADVTIRRNALEMSLYDSLTSIPNRRHFFHTLKEKLVKKEKLTLLLLDLDNFKQVNDTYGHIAGDTLLIEVAKRISTLFAGHFSARLAGDEFVILLNEEKKEQMKYWVELLIEQFTSSFSINGVQVAAEASIGIAIVDDTDTSIDSFFSRADSAMYQAKEMKGTSFYMTDMFNSNTVTSG